MRYLGMDVHGKATVYCLLDAQGQVVERGSRRVDGDDCRLERVEKTATEKEADALEQGIAS